MGQKKVSILVRCPEHYTVCNSSNPDTNGTEESVHISEVYLFQALESVLGDSGVRNCSWR